MKKFLLAAVVFTISVFYVSCSKESLANRKLDGDWSLQRINGEQIAYDTYGKPTNNTFVISFKRHRKEGTYTITQTYNGGSPIVSTGKYSLAKSSKKREYDMKLTDDKDAADNAKWIISGVEKDTFTATIPAETPADLPVVLFFHKN